MLGYRWEDEEEERGVETRVIGVCNRGGAATRCGALSGSGDADDIGERTKCCIRPQSSSTTNSVASLMFSKLGVQALDDSDDSGIQVPVAGSGLGGPRRSWGGYPAARED